MVCVLATAGGWGDLWVFSSRSEAYMHPLHQYGDALLSDYRDVERQYNFLELNRLRQMAGLEILDMKSLAGYTYKQQRSVVMSQSATIFMALTRLAHPAPTDPAEICRRIVEDRRRLGTVAKKKADAPAMPAEAEKSAKKERGEGGNLPPIVRGPKGVSQEATIRFGTDKEGREYGPEANNPKKEGSKTRQRFACYREGMTIAQALEAGVTTADLNYDRDHGYVKFVSSHGSAEGDEPAKDWGGEGEGEGREEQAAD